MISLLRLRIPILPSHFLNRQQQVHTNFCIYTLDTKIKFYFLFPGTEIIDIEVLDPDTVGTLTYQIISGNSNNVFNIDSTGRITLAAGGFDFEDTVSYSLNIRVFDGLSGVSSYTNIIQFYLLLFITQ